MYPTLPPPGWQPADDRERPTPVLAVFALVSGIVGFVIALGPLIFAVFGMAAGAVGVVLGIIATTQRRGRGLAIAGIVVGTLAVLLALFASANLSDALDDPSPGREGSLNIGGPHLVPSDAAVLTQPLRTVAGREPRLG